MPWPGEYQGSGGNLQESGGAFVDVRDPEYGAKGDGETDDTAAIQAALDAGAALGRPVLLPKPPATYFVRGLQLNYGQVVIGAGYSNRVLTGDAVHPIFRTGTYDGGINEVRNVAIYGVNAFNDGAPCVQIHKSPEWMLRDCHFVSNDSTAVDVKFSFVGLISRCKITTQRATKGQFALTLIDNCNSVEVTGSCRISGGSGGGAVDIAQCVNVICRPTVESSRFGVRVAGFRGRGRGNCHGINLDNLYLESIPNPLELALADNIFGLSLRNIWVWNGRTPTPGGIIKLGDVYGWELFGGDFNAAGSDTLIVFHRGTGSGLNWSVQGYVRGLQYSGIAAPYAFAPSFRNEAEKARVLHSGEKDFSTSQIFPDAARRRGYVHERVSREITSGESLEPGNRLMMIPAQESGGIIEKIELIDVRGPLDGVLSLGGGGSPGRHLGDRELSRVSLTHEGSYADLPIEDSFLPPGQPVYLMLRPGRLAGGFRVRVTYRA